VIEKRNVRPSQVVGPLGEALTMDSLPPSDTTRWYPRYKAEVVAAVHGGLLSVDEACDRYGLKIEELASWQRAIELSGMRGLRATRAQYYNPLYQREQRY
jgi:hypothetical protein